ncbi:hypothetical protein R3P38DRAFT_3057808 [Favolaschia claudopus]|uniref:Uncharacterized protein n=1 Tax=Favolaschia claudopus TaxID=2862362 RepID=A0AAW0A2B8_9AGAR
MHMYRLGSLPMPSITLRLCPAIDTVGEIQQLSDKNVPSLTSATRLCPAIDTVREIQQLSDKNVRSITYATRSMREDSDDSEWHTFLWSVAHPTRIRDLHPDPSLKVTAIWCLDEFPKKQNYFIPPSWSYILRSCPPTPDLLNALCRNQEPISSFIDNEIRNHSNPANLYHHWHNILKWLQMFSDPPVDMLEFVKNHLPADYVEDDAMWIGWKEYTGW